jgi:GDP-L-fucose synthase
MTYDISGERVWVTGHRGMVGSAVVRRLSREPCRILTADRAALDLRRQDEVEAWMTANRPQVVVIAAAKVGGIHANATYPADFLYDNLAIEANVIHAAFKLGVEKLLFLGSSCIYPREAPQPMAEEALLAGPLEPTNQWYAIAKIAGIKLCQAYRRQHGCDFISAMPTNLYGPGDNFHPTDSHVPAALLRRLHEAKEAGLPEVTVWGSGRPRREFLHVDDLADACVFLLTTYSNESHVNVGTGEDVTVAEFAEMVRRVVGWEGRLVYDTSRPDGMPRKVLDVSRLAAMGWRAMTPLEEGLRGYYRWFLDNIDRIRQ